MMELPAGWVMSTLLDAGNWGSGGTPLKSNNDYYENGTIPWLVIGDLNDGYVRSAKNAITDKGLQNSSAKLVSVGTLLVAMYGSIGKLGLTEIECATNQAIAFCEVDENLFSKKYLFYFLLSSRKSLLSLGKGGAQQNISQTVLKEFPVLVPPLNEQIRIVNILDSLIAKVDVALARLDKIPVLLKRFRQSVLAAATSGELTKEWREDTQVKWELLSIDDLAEVKGGKRLPKGEELVEKNTGFPYIRAGQLKQGSVINTDDARSRQLYLTPEIQSKISRYTVNKGDVYLTIVGASIGDAGVIPNQYDRANLTENAAKLTEFKKPLLSEFLAYWLRSEEMQDLIKREIKSGAQGKLALKRIKELPAPYTNIEEQKEIVRRVESLFALADSVEKHYIEAKKRTDRLTQSLLAKAFRGELVLQDPSDEPAPELLKRIQAEREQQTATKLKRKAKRGNGSTIFTKNKSKEVTMKLNETPDTYLVDLLTQLGGEADAKVLWNKTELTIDDFYAKLKQEMEFGHIIDDKASSDPSQRKLQLAKTNKA